MRQASNLGVVVLAAGASTRLGQPKQLLPFCGKNLLQHILDQTATLAFSSRVLVLGAHAAQIQAAITPDGWTVVINLEWATGMSSSLQAGIRENLRQQPDTSNLLVLLADQPFIRAAFLHQLVTNHTTQRAPITASTYGDITGVPAIFSQAYFAELMALEGDQGARKLLKTHAAAVQCLPFEGGAFDIDTPEDVGRLRAMGYIG